MYFQEVVFPIYPLLLVIGTLPEIQKRTQDLWNRK